MTATLLGDEAEEDGNACREQVAGLEDWLAAVEEAGLALALSLLDEGARLVERSGPPVDEPAPLVHVTRERVFLDGVPTSIPAGLNRELTELIELRRTMMPESPFIKSPRSYVAVDRDVPWSRVVDVVGEAAAAGVVRVTLLFSDKARRVPLPPPSPIDRELDRMQRGTQLRRQQIAAELIAYVYQDCPEGLKVIASMGMHPVADFKQVILDDLPAAIGACGCAADDASVKSLHWAIFGNPRPTSGLTFELASPGQGPSVQLQHGPEVSWQQLYESVVAAVADSSGRAFRFVVEPGTQSADAEVEKRPGATDLP